MFTEISGLKNRIYILNNKDFCSKVKVVRLYSMGRIIFGLLTISKNYRLLLYIVISVEVVMVVVLMLSSTLL